MGNGTTKEGVGPPTFAEATPEERGSAAIENTDQRFPTPWTLTPPREVATVGGVPSGGSGSHLAGRRE